jgi:hypothetical protein
MRIYVTKDDIAHGRPCSAGRCPIARSLIRRFPRSFISVGPHGVTVEDLCIPLPAEAQRFIQKFDHNHSNQKPFSFTLSL